MNLQSKSQGIFFWAFGLQVLFGKADSCTRKKSKMHSLLAIHHLEIEATADPCKGAWQALIGRFQQFSNRQQ